MHYYKRDIGKYYKKAGRLTMLQHGAYTMLMDACYDREVFPTIEQAIDWCWASTNEEIEAVNFVLSKFFTKYDDVFKQSQITETLEKYHSNKVINKAIAVKREADKRTKREQTVDDSTTNEHLITNKELLITNQELEIKNYKSEITNQELTTKDQDQKIISSKLDNVVESQVLLNYLNDISGKSFKHVDSNLKLIKARLNEGHSEKDIYAVIDRKVTEWENDPKMAKYIRPATLFNAEKFNQYVGELGVETPDQKRDRELSEWANTIEGELQ